MTRTEKVKLVTQMTESFTSRAAIVVCEYKGMTVHGLEAIRNEARANDINVKVVKNTLAIIALKNAGQESVALVDTNLLIWGDDQIATCKIAETAANNNKEKFLIKSGLLDGVAVDARTVVAMAKLPGREELLGMLLNVWNGPARSFAIGLQALATKKSEEA